MFATYIPAILEYLSSHSIYHGSYKLQEGRKWDLAEFWFALMCSLFVQNFIFIYYTYIDNLVLSTGLIMWIGHRKEIRELRFRALAQSEFDKGLTLETSASESLYGGNFTLCTQLIKPNCLAILPPTQHHSFFRNLPPITLIVHLLFFSQVKYMWFSYPLLPKFLMQKKNPEDLWMASFILSWKVVKVRVEKCCLVSLT